MELLNRVMNFLRLRSLDDGKRIEHDVQQDDEYLSLKEHVQELEKRAIAADVKLAEFEATMDFK